jgi:uncharacterized integral membrane protein
VNQRRNRWLAVCTLGALVAGILVAAPVAGAQVAGVEQYQPGGGGNQGAGDQGGSGGGGENPANASGEIPGAGAAESSTGDLPFTGYPLTALVLIVGILVTGGLVFRLVAEARASKPSRVPAQR